ncbi:MAG: indolepyruvate oxidoreductase subunit beta family protein [Deltaproteobacteria bacterium]
MSDKRDLIKIIIPAVGGQGGGILAEWLIQAFILEGFPAQGVGLPGLAQRGGSTLSYIEAYPEASGGAGILFSQHPTPGEIDVILCQEFLELGRALEQGFGSDKTVIVSSTHRIYSTREKLPLGNGVYSSRSLEEFARAFSSRFIGFDALDAAKKAGLGELGVNSILLGALGASGAIPLGRGALTRAIEGTGIAVQSNLKGFGIGWEIGQSALAQTAPSSSSSSPSSSRRDWRVSAAQRADTLSPRARESYLPLVSQIDNYPAELGEVLAEALDRLVDFQGAPYAEGFFSRVSDVLALDDGRGGFRLTEIFAKNLALWMSYEDAIRVAELKTKPQRFERIREQARISNNQILRVTDYLKPDAEEIWGLLPDALVRAMMKLGESGLFKSLRRRDKLAFEQTPVTSSLFGYLRLRAVARLKFMRPYSYRFRREREAMDGYKSAVEGFARIDYELGCLAARSGEIVKGYGDVRRRTLGVFSRFLNNVLSPVAEMDKSAGAGFALTVEVASKSLQLISESTEGIDKAEALCAGAIAQRARIQP